jgi:hypothetical protein
MNRKTYFNIDILIASITSGILYILIFDLII